MPKRKTEKRKPRCWFDDLEDDLKKKRKAKKGKPRKPKEITVLNGLTFKAQPGGTKKEIVECRRLAAWLCQFADWSEWAEAQDD